MLEKESRQMPRSNAEAPGKLIDVSPIERSGLDKDQCALDRCSRSLPCRTERSRFGTASEAWSEAGAFRGSGATIEPHIAGQWCARRTHRPAVDTGCPDRHEDDTVPRGVTTLEGFVLACEVEHATALAAMGRERELQAETTSENDHPTQAVRRQFSRKVGRALLPHPEIKQLHWRFRRGIRCDGAIS